MNLTTHAHQYINRYNRVFFVKAIN